MAKMQAARLTAELAHFTGSEQFYRWNHLFKTMIITDGVKFLCDNAECWWLVDLIASHQKKALRDSMLQDFQVWTLKVDLEKSTAVAICERDTGNVFLTQKIPYSDFPLAEITLWVERADSNMWTILLPSEH